MLCCIQSSKLLSVCCPLALAALGVGPSLVTAQHCACWLVCFWKTAAVRCVGCAAVATQRARPQLLRQLRGVLRCCVACRCAARLVHVNIRRVRCSSVTVTGLPLGAGG
jgi:hypothetical protein